MRLILFLLCGVAFILVAASFAIKYTREVAHLRALREHIEAKFAEEIRLIERHSKKLPDNFEDDLDSRQVILDEIAMSLSSPDIYWATWSLDGHHGLDGLVSRGSGYSTSQFPKSMSEDGLHSLTYGKARDDQTDLVVYKGRIPAGRKEVYYIAFLLENLDREINQKSRD
jgi:hypothetical protein